jgi:serine/threonine-protein kinase
MSRSSEGIVMKLGYYEYDAGQSALGGGAMGNVHRARDTRTGIAVALKVLHPHLAEDDESILRLRREARLASRIHHPNIARPLDQGQDGDVYWVAMELVDGRSLKRRIKDDGRVTEAEALAVGIALTRALQAAHEAGVVHRDVKPGNILLTQGREFDVTGIKLWDFGASRGGDLTRITRGPAFVGTPEYTAPEAFDLKTSERSDIYALGVTLYEIVTGRLPFSGDFGTLERAHRGRSPDMLPVRHAAPLLATVIERMLAKSVRGRYQNAAAVLSDLESIKHPLTELAPNLPFGRLDEQTVLASRAASTVRTAWRLPLRWKLASAGLLLVAAASSIAAVSAVRDGGDVRVFYRVLGGWAKPTPTAVEGSLNPADDVPANPEPRDNGTLGDATRPPVTTVGTTPPRTPPPTPDASTSPEATEPIRTATPVPPTTEPPPHPSTPPPTIFVGQPTTEGGGFAPIATDTPTATPTSTPTSSDPVPTGIAVVSGPGWQVHTANATPSGNPGSYLGDSVSVCLTVACGADVAWGYTGTATWQNLPGAPWMWHPGLGPNDYADGRTYYFVKDFTFYRPVGDAYLTLGVDNGAVVWIDGHRVPDPSGGGPPYVGAGKLTIRWRVPVSMFNSGSSHSIMVWGVNGGILPTCPQSGCSYQQNPAGTVVKLEVLP